MKAAWFERFGKAQDALIVGQQPSPVAASGEVLVQLLTSGVNPSDVKKRAGSSPNLLDEGSVIPHSDGAGIITAVGAGVPQSRIGERVFVYQAQYGRRGGTAAQTVAIDSRRAPKLPEQASFEVGACIGIPMLTAHRCVLASGSVEGKTVLVTGGAGRVGYYAIQFAKHFGARVVATASNEADMALCRSLGAEYVVNHRQPDWGAAVHQWTSGEKIQRVVDVEFGANLPEVMKCIDVGGTIATYSSTQVTEPRLPFLQMMFLDLTLRMVLVYAMPEEAKEQAVADTCMLLERQVLQHRIAHVVPLEDIARSHELIERGGFGGCVVVSVDTNE